MSNLQWDQAGGNIGNPAALGTVISGLQQARDALEAARVPAQIVATLVEIQYWLDLAMTLASGSRVIGLALGQILIDLVRPYLSDGAYILSHTNVADVIQQRGLRTLLQHGQDPFATSGEPPPYAGDVFTDTQSRLTAGVRGGFAFARQVQRAGGPLSRNPAVREILSTLAEEPQQNFDVWLQDFLEAFYDEADPLRPVLYASDGPLTPGQRFEVGPAEFGGYIFTVETLDPTVLFRTLSQLRDLFRTSSPTFINPISVIPLDDGEEYDWRRDLANFAMFRGPARERIRMVSSTPDFQRLSTADLMPLVDRFANLLNFAAGFVGPPLLLNVNLDAVIQAITETFLRILRALDLILSTLTQFQMLLSIPGVSILRIPLSRQGVDDFTASILAASATRDDLVRVTATPPLFREQAVDDPTVENPTELAIAGTDIAFANQMVDSFRRTWATGRLVRDRRVEEIHGSYVGRGSILRRSEAQRIAAAVPEFQFGPVENLLVGGIGVFYQRGPLSQFLDGLFNRSRRGGGSEEDPASPEDIVDELRQVQSALSTVVTASIPRLSIAPTAPGGSRASTPAARGTARATFSLADDNVDRFGDPGQQPGDESGFSTAQLSSPLGVVSRPLPDVAASGAGTGFRRWGAVVSDAALGADADTDAQVAIAGSWRRMAYLHPAEPSQEVEATAGQGPPLGPPGADDDLPASARVASRFWRHGVVSQEVDISGLVLQGPRLTCAGVGVIFSMPEFEGHDSFEPVLDIKLQMISGEVVALRTRVVRSLGSNVYLIDPAPPSAPLATVLSITVVERSFARNPADEIVSLSLYDVSRTDVVCVSGAGRKVPLPGWPSNSISTDARQGFLSAHIEVGSYAAAISPATSASQTGPLLEQTGADPSAPQQTLSSAWASGSRPRSWSPDQQPSPSTDRRLAASSSPPAQWKFSGEWATAMATLPLSDGLIVGMGAPAAGGVVYFPRHPDRGDISEEDWYVVVYDNSGDVVWHGDMEEALTVTARTGQGFLSTDPVTTLLWADPLPFDPTGTVAVAHATDISALAVGHLIHAFVCPEVAVEETDFRPSATLQAAWERTPAVVTVGAVPVSVESAVSVGAAHRHADRLWLPAAGLRGVEVFAGSPAGNARQWYETLRSSLPSSLHWPTGRHRILTLQAASVDVIVAPVSKAVSFVLSAETDVVTVPTANIPTQGAYLHLGLKTAVVEGGYRWSLRVLVSDDVDPTSETATVLVDEEASADQDQPLLSRACEGGSVLMGALLPLGEDPDVSGHPATSLVSSESTPAISETSLSALPWIVYATRTVILQD